MLYLKGQSEEQSLAVATVQDFPMAWVAADRQTRVANVPAFYYGTVEASETLVPTGGMSVTALISGTVCGEGTTRKEGGVVEYAVPVVVDGALGGKAGCGVPGVPVTFQVGDVMMQQHPQWQNDTSTNLTLRADAALDGLVINYTSPITVGTSVPYTATVITGTNVLYDWTFGDGTIARGQDVTHAYTQTGTYTVTVTAHNSVSSQQATGVITVVKQIACLQDAITSLTLHVPKQATVYEETHITAEPSGGTDRTYTWDFGDGTTSVDVITNTVVHMYTNVGTHTVTVTATNACSSITQTAEIAVGRQQVYLPMISR